MDLIVSEGNRVRLVRYDQTVSQWIITAVAGDGSGALIGGAANQVGLGRPWGMTVATVGTKSYLYVADSGFNVVSRMPLP